MQENAWKNLLIKGIIRKSYEKAIYLNDKNKIQTILLADLTKIFTFAIK